MSRAGGSIARSALLGGLLGTVLVATPVLSGLNGCCCLLVVLSSAFAGWSLRIDSEGRASTSACALAGMLSGMLTAMLGVPLRAVLSRLAFGVPHLEAELEEKLEQARRAFEDFGFILPPDLLEGMEAGARASSGLELNGWLIVSAIFAAAGYGLFGLMGGFLGARLGKRSSATPAPPSAGPVAAAPVGAPPETEPPAPPVMDEDGEPDVRWQGETLGQADAPAVAPQGDAEAGGLLDDEPRSMGGDPGRGEIPLDELPLLPPRREGDGASPAGAPADAPDEPPTPPTPPT